MAKDVGHGGYGNCMIRRSVVFLIGLFIIGIYSHLIGREIIRAVFQTKIYNNIDCIALQPNGNHIVYGGNSDYAGLLNGNKIVWENHFGKDIASVDFHPNGKMVAVASRQHFKVFDLSGKVIFENECNIGQYTQLKYSPNGKLIAVYIHSSGIQFLDANDGSLVFIIPSDILCSSMSFSMDGNFIAFAGSSNRIYLADMQKREIIREFDDSGLWINNIEFSPDGKYITSTSWSTGDELNRRALCVWEVETGKEFKQILYTEKKSPYVDAFAYSADGKYLVASYVKYVGGKSNCFVKRYEMPSGKEINSVKFSDDNRIIAIKRKSNGDFILATERNEIFLLKNNLRG